MAEQVSYFAFGSNMLTERLVRRCPSARPIGPALLEDHILEFSKISREGSGKATVVKQATSRTYGVLYMLDAGEIGLLDAFEGRGKGYDRVDDCVLLGRDGRTRTSACTYMAPPAHRDPSLLPFDWYHALVVAGARQHKLPPAYISALAATARHPDPDPRRPAALEAREVLARAGFPLEA